MTAQIITPNHWPRHAPVAEKSHVESKTPVTHMRPETEARADAWAEEQFFAGLRAYRARFSSEMLIERLNLAAKTEATLAERAS